MITAAPSSTFEATASGFATGLTGTIGVRILDNAGATTTARVTAGIAEYPASSGVYYVSLTAPSTAGQYTLLWDNGSTTPGNIATENLVVTYTITSAATAAANEYVGADTLKATLNLAGETYADDDVLAAVVAASRQIDQWCGRRFYKDSSDTTRYYTPIRPGRLNIHDLADLTSVSVDQDSDGTFETTWTENTEFTFDPLNAETDGWPRTAIRVVPRSGAYLPCEPRAVKVVGRHGWDTVPPAVVQATTILASRLLKRARETPYGISAVGLEGEAVRISAIDPDVNALIQPYKRLTAV